jgi:hypothetical protein
MADLDLMRGAPQASASASVICTGSGLGSGQATPK